MPTTSLSGSQTSNNYTTISLVAPMVGTDKLRDIYTPDPENLFKIAKLQGALKSLTPPRLSYMSCPLQFQLAITLSSDCVALYGTILSFRAISNKEFYLYSVIVMVCCTLPFKESLNLKKQYVLSTSTECIFLYCMPNDELSSIDFCEVSEERCF